MRLRRIKLCGCVSAIFLLLLVIVIVILAFTVFKVKDPKITTNSFTLTNLDLIVSPMSNNVNVNMTLLIDMSIKNPNSASFKFGNTTTTIYYHGVTVAEAWIPPGLVKARRTSRMNVTADVLADRLASSPDLMIDVRSGHMTMNTYTMIAGRVKVLIIKKHVKLRMNCTVNVNISSRTIQDIHCRRKVKI